MRLFLETKPNPTLINLPSFEDIYLNSFLFKYRKSETKKFGRKWRENDAKITLPHFHVYDSCFDDIVDVFCDNEFNPMDRFIIESKYHKFRIFACGVLKWKETGCIPNNFDAGIVNQILTYLDFGFFLYPVHPHRLNFACFISNPKYKGKYKYSCSTTKYKCNL